MVIITHLSEAVRSSSNMPDMRFLIPPTCLLVAALAGHSLPAFQQPPASQQPAAPPSSGAISGVVVDGPTGAPVSEAIVSLSGGTLPATYRKRQLTDAKGRFAFLDLPDADAFQVTAFKFGFLDGGYGRDSAPTDALRPIVVKSGAWVPNLRVPIWRASAVSGSVRDENGTPVVGVIVRALARIRLGGRDELAAGPVTITDDRGLYRLSGLMPGRYLIHVPSVQMSVPGSTAVTGPATNAPEGPLDYDDTARLVIGRYPLPPPRVSGRAMSYAGTFHPGGSTLAQATLIELKSGDEHTGADVTLAPVPTSRVSGVVEGPSEALANLTVRLLPAGLESLGLGAETATALVSADGAFTFLNVPPGAYTIDAPIRFNEFTMSSGPSFSGGTIGSRGASLPPLPPRGGWSSNSNSVEGLPGVSYSSTDYRGGNQPNYSGRAAVTVGAGDVTGLAVRLRPTMTVHGRLVLEPDQSKPAPRAQGFSLVLDPAGGQPSLGMPSVQVPAGATEFEIAGLQQGEYWLRMGFNNGWLVKSVLWRGRDYASAPIDTAGSDDLSGVVVTLTNAVPIVSGTVRAQSGAAPESGIVVAFPTLPELRVNAGLSPIRMKSTPMQSNGTFRFANLPAGDYFVAAIDRSHFANWRDPEFLATLERTAARVTLAWGRTVNQDLTMTVAR